MHRKSDFYQIFFFFSFWIVYNKVLVISSKDSHIVHDQINRRKL